MTVVFGFVVTSALCGAAWNVESLIAFRVLQGFAGGMIMPIGMITLAQASGPGRIGRVMSIVGVPMLLAPVFGPMIGGAIVQTLSWRWIFFVNLPVGIVGLLLARRMLPSGRAAGRASADGHAQPVLDWRGLALLSPGVAAIVFGISEYGAHRTFSVVSAWLPLVLGLLAVGAFVVHGLRTRYPIVDVGLFRSGGFAAAAATVFLTGVALFGSMILLPLYYQIARGESPLIAGLLIAPQGLGAVIGMNLGGRAVDRFGGGRVVIVGLLFLIAGTAIFANVDAGTPYWLVSVGLVLRGIGLGGSMMPAMAAAYATLKREQVPRATPALNVLQRVGGSLGAAMLIVILQNRIISSLGEGAQGGVSGAALPDAARERVAAPLAEAFAHTFWYALALSVAALIPAAVLVVQERKARQQSADLEAASPAIVAA
jgi:EmrB/QacA subfamily drug resistance transporter